MAEIKLLDQTTKEVVEIKSENPLQALQEGFDYNMLEKTYVEWKDFDINNDDQLSKAKAEKNKLVKIRTGIEKKRKELVAPVNKGLKKIKSHSDGLQGMVSTVEKVIVDKIFKYEESERIKFEQELQKKRAVVNSILDPIVDNFNTIKTIDDCDFVKEELDKYSPEIDDLGEEVYGYAKDKKNEMLGKLVYIKSKLQEARIAELESKQKKEAEKTVEKPAIIVEKVPEVKPQVDEESKLYHDLQRCYALAIYDKYSEGLNALPKEKIYKFMRWVVLNTDQDPTSLVEMLRFLK